MGSALSGRRGFTLIELLVVIAIIAILASILLPVIVAAKEQGRKTACLNNLKQLGIAFRMYADDYQGTTPAVGWEGNKNWCGCPGSPNMVKVENGQIWKYVKNKKLYLCPTDRGVPAKSITNKPKTYPLSYSMNSCLEIKKLDFIVSRRLSEMMLLIHEARDRINDGIFEASPGNNQDIPCKVHGSGTTLLYADGHARSASYETLLRERNQGHWVFPARLQY